MVIKTKDLLSWKEEANLTDLYATSQATTLLRFLSSAGFDNFGANDNENEEQDGRELTLKGCD